MNWDWIWRGNLLCRASLDYIYLIIKVAGWLGPVPVNNSFVGKSDEKTEKLAQAHKKLTEITHTQLSVQNSVNIENYMDFVWLMPFSNWFMMLSEAG